MNSNKFQWIHKEPSLRLVEVLASELNVSKIISKILVNRGVVDFTDAQNYFRPNLDQFHDGFLMKGMEKAVVRLNAAVRNNETILIYGDYDVDGTCAVALMVEFLQKLNGKVLHYQPQRDTEGYGISLKSVAWCKENSIDLIIALDCGIKDLKASKAIREINIDLIICDHHKPGDLLPEVFSILNPKQDDCQYPFKELCGCGIGFKLIQSYLIKYNLDIDLNSFYQLAAVATAADVVPLINENRLLVFFGLKAINKTPIAPFQILFEKLNVQNNFNLGDLIFKIAPRINAAGRLDSASMATNFLISNSNDAERNLLKIESINEKRKTIDEQITAQALEQLNKQSIDRFTNFVYSPDWHKGVVGIVASRIIEKYYFPTIVLTGYNDLLTGSARSVKGFDLYKVLNKLKHFFVRFGGHKYAAGLSLKKENLDLFKEAFELEVKNAINKDDLIPKIYIDSELSLDDLFENRNQNNTPKLYRILQQMEPFGIGNPKPNFIFKQLLNNIPPKIVGNIHLKFQLTDTVNNRLIDAIWFNSIDSFNVLKKASYMDVVGSIDENIYLGKRNMQILIKDVRIV